MKRYFLYTICFLYSVIALGQVSFTATAEKTTLKIGERTQIAFELNAKGDGFTPPSFKGFQVGGPFVSNSMSIVNGDYSVSQKYIYTIQATKEGSYSIEPATIEYKGKVLKTKPLKITVGKGNTNSNATINTNTNTVKSRSLPKNTSAVFLTTELSKNTAYINEPVEIEYRLYMQPGVEITSVNGIKNPKINNAWSKAEEVNDPKWRSEVINGKRYGSKVFYKAIIYPQKTGVLEIEPITLDLELYLPTGYENFWGEAEYDMFDRVLKSDAKTVKVLPLPEKGKPEDFTGAVGSYNFDVEIDKNAVKTGEAFQLIFSVTGTGNLKLFRLPKPNLSSDFEVFEPTHKENITETINGMKGTISDIYSIIPQKAGKIELPLQNFSYFDVATKTYKTLKSNSFSLDIAQGEKNIALNPVIQNSNALLPIKTVASFIKKDEGFFNSNWYYASLLVICGFGLFFLIKKPKEKELVAQDSNAIEEKEVSAPKQVTFNKTVPHSEDLSAFITDKDLFYNKLEQQLLQKLSTKYGDSDITDLASSIENKKAVLGEEVYSKMDTLNKTIQMAKFVPTSESDRISHLDMYNEITRAL
jgi:hypothetical protein